MKTVEELFTPAKVQMDKLLAQSPETLFVVSLNPSAKIWHLGVRKFRRYSRSGLIAGVSYVTKCSGRQLGGAWGYAKKSELFDADEKCSRCFAVQLSEGVSR
jgi:hypothetical protein